MPNGENDDDDQQKPPKPDPLEVTPAEKTDDVRRLREQLKEQSRRRDS